MPLPDAVARESMLRHKMKEVKFDFSDEDWTSLNAKTEGYSCSDVQAVVKEAAMCPVRELSSEQLMSIKDTSEMRPISLKDYEQALKSFAPSVSKATLEDFAQWQKRNGQA